MHVLPPRVAAALAATLTAAALGAGMTGSAQASPAEEGCNPTAANRPVCPVGSPARSATFLDPSVVVAEARKVRLHEAVYVAPFAELHGTGGGVEIGPESNVQDNVRVFGRQTRPAAEEAKLGRVGLRPGSGVDTGERVILAHGSTVRGPARLGVGPVINVPDGHGGTVEDSGVFVSFGAEVDGAVLERDSGLSALARVGPGVRLKTGFIVLPGKNVTTQEEAQNPRLGKVRAIEEVDREFNAGVVEVNVGLAREYTRLFRDNPTAVRGVSPDPGGNVFDQERDLPTINSATCTGPTLRRPGFRNRIIGDICFEDSYEGLDRKLGSEISLRADEGGPFRVGTITRMGDEVIFHALEGNDVSTGDRVSFGARSIVHGGGRPQLDPTTGLAAPTIVGNDVRLGAESIVFRSLLRNATIVGERSAVVATETRIGQVLAPRTIYANDVVAGTVEW